MSAVGQSTVQRPLVLVVDDEALVRSATRRILSRSGHEVLTASDGFEALELYRENAGRIGCVLLDLTMPRMDGIETLAGLRCIDPAVKVLIVSGLQQSELEARFEAIEQPTGFIRKPFRLEALDEASTAPVQMLIEVEADEQDARSAVKVSFRRLAEGRSGLQPGSGNAYPHRRQPFHRDISHASRLSGHHHHQGSYWVSSHRAQK